MLCRFHQILCQHIHKQTTCKVARVNRDLIIPQLHQFFDAQFVAVSRKREEEVSKTFKDLERLWDEGTNRVELPFAQAEETKAFMP